jgi:hypothetical protein
MKEYIEDLLGMCYCIAWASKKSMRTTTVKQHERRKSREIGKQLLHNLVSTAYGVGTTCATKVPKTHAPHMKRNIQKAWK